eukprot:CAMPEP_0198306240 /NCGR_PEP_ID=MMETSP1449-20131203/58314_1 /TAXON_ID=420275 /ORGANISM="Attheya septentrionalis, Strain CCMP2084" /LENGTH=794 /DNA_ID=CAMNT_0044008789 /DNA_START=832 /DNA_END=3216 /DNA_ORIENTATION=+
MTQAVVEHGDHVRSQNNKNKGPAVGGGGPANNIPHKPSKLGRKGDPRMHLALGLRLVTPEMSLLDALRGGGFVFSTNHGHINDNHDEPQLDDTTSSSKGVMVDDDMVPLGQRKNQLSRRLRLAKQAMENNLPVNLGDYIISNGRVVQGPDSDGKVMNHPNHAHAYANAAMVLPHKHNANKNKGPSQPPRTNNNNNNNIGNHKINKRRTRAGSDVMGSPNQSQLPRSDSFLSIDTNYLREQMGVQDDENDEQKAIQRIARNHPMYGMSFPVTNPFSQAQTGRWGVGGGGATSQNSNTSANGGGNNMVPIMQNVPQQQQQQQFSNSFPYGMMNPQLGGGTANSNKLNVFDQAQQFVAHMGIGGTSVPGGGPMMNTMNVPSGSSHGGSGGTFPGQGNNMMMSNALPPQQQQHGTSQNQAGLMGMSGGQLPGGGRLPNGLQGGMSEQAQFNEMMENALNFYHIESETMFKRCLLMAGFSTEPSQDYDRLYVTFADMCLAAETSRINKLRNYCHFPASTASSNNTNDNGTAGTSHGNNNMPPSNGGGGMSNSIGPTNNNAGPHMTSSLSSERQSNSLQGGNNVLSGTSAIDKIKALDEHQRRIVESLAVKNDKSQDQEQDQDHHNDHDHDNAHKMSHDHSSEQNHDPGHAKNANVCGDGRHVHQLEGKCGHRAVIHHPEGGHAHVDFVVNGKVECYHGVKSVESNKSGLWKSRFNCAQLCCEDQLGCDQVNQVMKNFQQQSGGSSPSLVETDPVLLDLGDIDLQSKEWNIDIFSRQHTTTDDALVNLLNLDNTTNVQGV